MTSDGPHYPLPLTGEGTTGLGKPLKPITHPLRADIPIMLGAEGPKNVALAAEICDGWLPIFYTPRMADMYNEWLDEGFARPGARRTREDFEICATANIVITDDRAGRVRRDEAVPRALHGRDGRRGHQLPRRRLPPDGLRRGGRRRDRRCSAPTARTRRPTVIPDELVDDSAIVGDLDYVREQIKVWEAAGVTMMVRQRPQRRADPRARRPGVDTSC